MELFIVVLAVFLIFRTEIKKMINENWADISENAVPLIKYFGSSILLTTALGLFPSLMMVVYMRSQGFFAYELFNGDSHAFNVLSGNIFLNYLILSFGFYGSVLMIAKNASKIAIAGFGLFNAIFILYFVLLAADSTHWVLLVIMLVTTLSIAGYAYFMVSSGIKGRAKAWFMPLIAAAVLMVSPVMFSPYASQLARVSLSQMKVGGLVVTIAKAEDILKKEDERKYKQMWLVLRTPEQLYLKDEEHSPAIMILKSPEYLLSMKAPVGN